LIAGAAAGGAVALAAVAFAAFVWYRRCVASASKAPTMVSIGSPSAVDFSASASASADASTHVSADVELKEDISQVANDRYV